MLHQDHIRPQIMVMRHPACGVKTAVNISRRGEPDEVLKLSGRKREQLRTKGGCTAVSAITQQLWLTNAHS